MEEQTKRLGMVQKLIDVFNGKAEKKDATVADFIRLVGLEQEFESADKPCGKIEVTWRPTSETAPSK